MAGRQRQKITERVAETITGNISGTTIRGVRILGERSLNGRTYTRPAMEAGASKYAGVRIFADHPQGTEMERSLRDLVGTIESPRFVPEKGEIRGDMVLLETHPLTATILEMATKNSRMFGLSHIVSASISKGIGEEIVEAIEQVHSVDVVCLPATNSGLFESVGTDAFGPADDPDAGKAVDPLTGEPIVIPDPKAGIENGVDLDDNGEVFLTSLQRSFKDAIVAIATNPRLSRDQKKQQVDSLLDVYDAVDPNAVLDTPAAESFRPAAPGRRYQGLKPLTETAGASPRHNHSQQPHQQTGNYPAGGLEGLKLASSPEAAKRLADALRM